MGLRGRIKEEQDNDCPEKSNCRKRGKKGKKWKRKNIKMWKTKSKERQIERCKISMIDIF